MMTHLNFVSKAPWIARGTWVIIMLISSLFAAQWGITSTQVNTLLMVSGLYALVVIFAYFLCQPMSHNKQFMIFALDLMAWSLYLYHSGGASNPLITLFLTIVAVTSLVQSTRHIIGIALLSIMAYMMLWHFYQPLMMPHDHQSSEKLHLLGMFGVFVFALMMLTALTVYFKTAMGRNYRALQQAQQAIHQQRRVLAVSSLAANIAHEMSTPITSMQLLTQHIANQLTELDDDDELLEDIDLLKSQINLCHQSLNRLKTHIQHQETEQNWSLSSNTMTTQLDELLPKLIADWRFLNPHINITLPPFTTPVHVHINAEQLYSIIVNVLNNAVQAEATDIKVHIEYAQSVIIQISDNGNGIELHKIAKIKEQQPIKSDNGWGMGLMLAKIILNYVDGDISIQHTTIPKNTTTPKNTTIPKNTTGTQVIIKLAYSESCLNVK